MPPLAKFAASPFGIVERFAEPDQAGPALLPVTLRNVEAGPAQARDWCRAPRPARSATCSRAPTPTSLPGSARCSVTTNIFVSRKQARRRQGPAARALDSQGRDYVQSRMLSLLGGQPA
jgi:hypothetical protein